MSKAAHLKQIHTYMYVYQDGDGERERERERRTDYMMFPIGLQLRRPKVRGRVRPKSERVLIFGPPKALCSCIIIYLGGLRNIFNLWLLSSLRNG